MASSLSVLGDTATRKAEFAAHITDSQSYFYCSQTKQEPLSKVQVSDLTQYEFFQPTAQFCRFLIVDVDHIFASQYITDLPAEIQPHALVFTSQGVQAFWLIEGVPLTSKARPEPIRFARDVAEMLRQACNGDQAVNALTPSKCRNPLYSGADVVFPADCPPYSLKSLSKPLRAVLRAYKTIEGTSSYSERSRAVWGDLSAGQRNETIFQTVRRSAYRGEDFEALAYELNEQCEPPLALSEVAGIVRSVQKFMDKRFMPSEARREPAEPMPEQVREFLAEIGRKGGSQKTEAQTQALAKGANASRAVRSAQSIGRRAQIQALKEAGYTQAAIVQKTGLSRSTIKRAWK